MFDQYLVCVSWLGKRSVWEAKTLCLGSAPPLTCCVAWNPHLLRGLEHLFQWPGTSVLT